jgi:hypothetical protein
MAHIDTTVDRHGQDIFGEDDDGRWMGTEDQPVPLDDAPRGAMRRWVVDGYLGPEPFRAFVLARSEERVKDYFAGMRIRELEVERLWKSPKSCHS